MAKFADTWRRLWRSLAPTAEHEDPDSLWLYVRCERCGAVVRVRVDLSHDLNREENGEGTFLLRKEIMDDRCFQLIDASVWFDADHHVTAAYVNGGQLLTESEYLAAQSAEAPENPEAAGSSEGSGTPPALP